MKNINFYGLRRSGNHAFLSWVFDHSPNPCIHLDNVSDMSRKWDTFYQVKIKGYSPSRLKATFARRLRFVAKRVCGRGDDFTFVRDVDRFDPGLLPEMQANALVLASCEDVTVDQMISWKTCCETENNLLILRDPFNLVASLLKSRMIESGDLEDFVMLYSSYARLFSGACEVPGLLLVNFSRWVVDQSYRVALAEKIGFQTSGEAYQKVSHQGGGSSFEEQQYRKNAEKMDVLSRWEYLKINKSHRKFLEDDRLWEFHEALFSEWVNVERVY